MQAYLFLRKAYHVNAAIFVLTFTYLLFNSLFICLKSEIFTYCLECGVRRLGQGWIGAIPIFNNYYFIIIIIITIIMIDMKFFSYSHLYKTNFHNKGFAVSLVLKARIFGTRKWSIRTKRVSEKYSRHLRLKFPIRVCS